jgi:hypothetical protein
LHLSLSRREALEDPMPPPVLHVMNFNPVDADRAVPFVRGDGLGAPAHARAGHTRHLNDGAEVDMVNAACWNFVLNGGLGAFPAGLNDAGTIMGDIVGYAHAGQAGGGAAPNGVYAPPVIVPGHGDCTPAAVTATANTATVNAGDQLIRNARQNELQNKFNDALNDGYAVDIIDGVNNKAITVFRRTANQQDFHYLLVKTVIQLYGFTTISRERAALSHHTFGRQWMTIVVRCSTWWGWDHWAFKGTEVSGVHDVSGKYAQTVPNATARVGCSSFWDEDLPETRVYVSHMPTRVYNQLTALHA